MFIPAEARKGRRCGTGPTLQVAGGRFSQAIAWETLRKLEYETEEMSKRWAKTCNDV